MNTWGKKTIELARTKDYLDKLYDIYPNDPGLREVNDRILSAIRKSFENRDCKQLINQLLDLEKFPIKDSYVSFLREDRNAIARNPKTVRRICEVLYKAGFDEVRDGILAPKESNRARGQQFGRWLKKNFKLVSIDDFIKSKKGIAILDGSDKQILDFSNIQLNLGLSKMPDFVGKANGKYVVGEAKFLSATGGNQGRGLDDALKLASNTSGKAYKVAIVDGVLWIKPSSQEFKKIENASVTVFSSLLLKKFLEKID
ncbi:MAG: restriction endonuclease [Bacteroidetes bacterium]|nr:restriction endonuclease [Bacteroidota bacterium]MCL5737247.1 restriction endonuclease [Bacteroidota bacterium]